MLQWTLVLENYYTPGSYQSLQTSIWYKLVEWMDLPSVDYTHSRKLLHTFDEAGEMLQWTLVLTAPNILNPLKSHFRIPNFIPGCTLQNVHAICSAGVQRAVRAGATRSRRAPPPRARAHTRA